MTKFDNILEKISRGANFLDEEDFFEINWRITAFLNKDRNWSTAFPHNESGTWREMAKDAGAKPYTTDLNATLSFVHKALPTNSINLTFDPSGSGASITWWPLGLSGNKELKQENVSDDISLAIIRATFSLLRRWEKQLDPLVEPEVPQFVLEAFEERYKGQYDLKRFDYSGNWGNTQRYANDFIQAKWEGWRDGYLALKEISK